jgi:hypothetical protein
MKTSKLYSRKSRNIRVKNQEDYSENIDDDEGIDICHRPTTTKIHHPRVFAPVTNDKIHMKIEYDAHPRSLSILTPPTHKETQILSRKSNIFHAVSVCVFGSTAPTIKILKEGILDKVTPHLFKNTYKPRFCKVEEYKFSYYKNNVRHVLLDFRTSYLTIEAYQTKKQFRIKVQNLSKNLLFFCKFDYDEWTMLLQSQIAKHRPVEIPKQVRYDDQLFYKYKCITMDYFIKKAETGDLLLFTSKTFTSTMQRVITGSEYDHVGVILRYTNARLMILEATSNEVFELVGCVHIST